MPDRSPSDLSLFAAAIQLEQAADSDGQDPGWRARTRGAVRAATASVESRLGELFGHDGLAHEIAAESPRLIYATESLEARLAGMLVDLWESESQGNVLDPAFAGRLRRLAVQLRHLASREFDLLWESLNEPAAHD